MASGTVGLKSRVRVHGLLHIGVVAIGAIEIAAVFYASIHVRKYDCREAIGCMAHIAFLVSHEMPGIFASGGGAIVAS